MMSVAWLMLLAMAMPQPVAEAELVVMITSPPPGEFVFGEVEVEVEVNGDEKVTAVELLIDGEVRGKITGPPPYRWKIDVGDDNIEHIFRAVATGELGTRGDSTLVTPRIEINEQVDLELQQLYITAEGAARRILDLGQRDFRVFDNGAEQEIITFGRGDLPLTAVLLLDSSESMKGERLEAALRGARTFVDGMKSLDEAMLMLFSDQLLRATPFTNRTEVLREALDGVEAGGNTSINDHVYLALKLLDARQGRRVVVLFTDGSDLHSVLDMEDVLWKARRSQALVYWIRFDAGSGRSSFATAWRDAEGNRQEFEHLEASVASSGGRIATISEVEEIEPAFADILRELREQYVLGYYPKDIRNDGGWRDVDVKVSRSGVKIRTRGGYVD